MVLCSTAQEKMQLRVARCRALVTQQEYPFPPHAVSAAGLDLYRRFWFKANAPPIASRTQELCHPSVLPFKVQVLLKGYIFSNK